MMTITTPKTYRQDQLLRNIDNGSMLYDSISVMGNADINGTLMTNTIDSSGASSIAIAKPITSTSLIACSDLVATNEVACHKIEASVADFTTTRTLEPICGGFTLATPFDLATGTVTYLPLNTATVNSGGFSSFLAVRSIGAGNLTWGYQNISSLPIFCRISYSVAFQPNATGVREAWISTSTNCTPGGNPTIRRAYTNNTGSDSISLTGGCVIKVPPNEWFALGLNQTSGSTLKVLTPASTPQTNTFTTDLYIDIL